MHTAFIKLRVPADQAERTEQAMLTLVEPTLAEPGCVTYEFYRDLDEAGTFHCFEHWRSRDDFDAHGSMPHIRTFLEEFGPIIELWESHHATAVEPAGD